MASGQGEIFHSVLTAWCSDHWAKLVREGAWMPGTWAAPEDRGATGAASISFRGERSKTKKHSPGDSTEQALP